MPAMALNLDPRTPEAAKDLAFLRAAGFDEVEPNVNDPALAVAAADLARAQGLKPISLPTGRMACFGGEGSAKTRVVFQAAADAAAAIGVPVIVGLIRGGPTVSRQETMVFLKEEVLRALERHPKLIALLEPIAASDCAWPNTLADGVVALKELGSHPRIQLLADTVHLRKSNEVLDIAKHIKLIGLVQIEGDNRAIPTAADKDLIAAARAAKTAKIAISFEMPGNRVEHAQACMDWLMNLWNTTPCKCAPGTCC